VLVKVYNNDQEIQIHQSLGLKAPDEGNEDAKRKLQGRCAALLEEYEVSFIDITVNITSSFGVPALY
jgi:hypothetical protein